MYRQSSAIDIDAELAARIDRIRLSRPRRVVNATGVILHTNLGRSPWSEEATRAAAGVAAGYANVELDLTTGDRGRRNVSSEGLLTAVTGAEAALIVNNNAAAVFLVLLALARGGNVPVSRGELIEIGGSYRLPDLMAATGANLVEVGTTNRTRRSDYESVDDPALILKVHPSNYRVVGFTAETDLGELAEVAGSRGVPLVFDAGSGLLDERVPWLDGPPPSWLAGEPGVRQALEKGADLVLFSGDKLIGGPQAGILVGKKDLIDRLRRHPATRALRVDGSTDAALGATVATYLDGTAAGLPVWRMATADVAEISRRAGAIAERIKSVDLIDGVSTLGAGSAPGAEIPTTLLTVSGDDAYNRLLSHDPPILARRQHGSVVVDLRTVDPSDDAAVEAALATL